MITVSNLFFSYTKQPYFEDINFNVANGEIVGFLGPSGSGKSTLQKILIGLIKNYRGDVLINGISSKDGNADFYQKIGIDFEFSTLYEKLSAIENLKLFSSLYDATKLRDIDKLIIEIGLADAKDKKVSTYSKGMRSRLNFIKCLIHNPETLVLDEPTNGLDPVNSYQMKEMILKEKAEGKSIIITTHDMNIASDICDRVVFILNGKILLIDTPQNIIMKRKRNRVSFWYGDDQSNKVECELDNLHKNQYFIEASQHRMLKSIHSLEPTLEDVFIELSGKRLK